MRDALLPAMRQQSALGKHNISATCETSVRLAVPDQHHGAGGGARQLARHRTFAYAVAGRARGRQVWKGYVDAARLEYQFIRNHRNFRKTRITHRNGNSMIEAIANDSHR